MQVARDTAPGKLAGVLRWAHYLLVATGLAALAWCAALLTDAYMAQWRARASLEALASVSAPLGPATGDVPTERDAFDALAGLDRAARPPELSLPHHAFSEPRPPTPRGTALAELSIPRLNLSAMVLHGTDAHTLYVGVGHIENTAWPGDRGNVAIAGHRDTFFRPLRNIRMGDEVFLDLGATRLQYRVSSIQVVTPDNVSVLGPTENPTLTLITCFPFTFIGHAADRFVVRATRVTHGFD